MKLRYNVVVGVIQMNTQETIFRQKERQGGPNVSRL